MPVIALTQGMGSLAQDIAEQLAAGAWARDAAARGGRACRRQDACLQEPDQPLARRQGRAPSSGCAPTAKAMAHLHRRRSARGRGARQCGDARLGRDLPAATGAACPLRPHHAAARPACAVADGRARHRRRATWPRPRSGAATEPTQRACTSSSACNWGDPVLFDMVLNTDRLSVDTCVQQIKGLLVRPEFAETDASRALLQGPGAERPRARGAAGPRGDPRRRHHDRGLRRPGHVARHRASMPRTHCRRTGGGGGARRRRRSTTSCA